MDELRLDIPIYRYVQEHGMEAGHRYGYSTMIDNICRALFAQGVVEDESAPVRLSIPKWTDDKECGKEVWSYGMWEFPRMPKLMLEEYNATDFCVVPSPVIQQYFINAGVIRPVYVCPLGVDDDFVYRPRTYYRTGLEPFVFLWVGAHTQRKMGAHALAAFRMAFGNSNRVHLHYKTSKWAKEPGPMVARINNITADKRRLSRQELHGLYLQAHCLIHTCPMEGFGLPPAEAMATGCLVLAPAKSALQDFVTPQTAIVMDMEPHEFRVSSTPREGVEGEREVFKVPTWRPNIKKLVQVMRYIIDHYPETEELRRRGAALIDHRYRWDKSARQLLQLIRTHSRRLGHAEKRTRVDNLQGAAPRR